MNLMLISIAQRSREIGLRRAIGARASDISRQFLLESLFVALAGGAAGVAVGLAVAIGLDAAGLVGEPHHLAADCRRLPRLHGGRHGLRRPARAQGGAYRSRNDIARARRIGGTDDDRGARSHQELPPRQHRDPGAQGRVLPRAEGRVRGHHGALGVGQIDLAQHPRPARSTRRRQLSPGRHGLLTRRRRDAVGGAKPA